MGFSSAASPERLPPAPAAQGNPLDSPAAGGSAPCRIPLRLTQSPPRPLLEPRPRSPQSPSDRHPPRGWLPTSAPPAAPLPDRCTWGSQAAPPAPQRRLFCRRSAAAPPGSSSIAPGEGRGLGRTQGELGPRRGSAGRSATARRSPRPPPRASARPRPRPKLSSRLRPSMGGSRPRPGPRLSPSILCPSAGFRPRPTPPRAAAPPTQRLSAGSRPTPAPPRSPATPLSHRIPRGSRGGLWELPLGPPAQDGSSVWSVAPAAP